MWKAYAVDIDRQTVKTALFDEAKSLSYGNIISLWQTNVDFRQFFTKTLSQCKFDAYFWETPPVTAAMLIRPFEFVQIESGTLAHTTPDSGPFEAHFSARKSESVLTFPNLGGDAILVVPAPISENACYTHLAKFLRVAPTNQVDEFWKSVGYAMAKQTGSRPVWLSTAGLGVSWLHLRLDSRPKYYRHAPYKTI